MPVSSPAPVANGVQTVVDRAALRFAESDRFETLWENANRRVHAAVVNVLTGGGSRVSTEDGTVAINTAQIIDNVKAKLDARGITVFDDVDPPAGNQEFVLFQSEDLTKVQGLVDLLQTLAWVLPFVALACFAAAIGLSGNRRRTIQRGAIGVAFAVALELVLLKAGRNLYLDAVTTKKSTPGAAGSVWDQLTSFLRTAGLTVIALALVIAFAAWVVGPSSAATSFRGWWHRVFGNLERVRRRCHDAGARRHLRGPLEATAPRYRRGARIRPADRVEPPHRAHRPRHRAPARRLPRHPRTPRAPRDARARRRHDGHLGRPWERLPVSK